VPESHTSANTDTSTATAPASPTSASQADGQQRFALRFATGLILYCILIAGYFFVLRTVGEPLLRLYNARTVIYAFVGLSLIVTQGVVLESITTFLAEQLGIVTHEEE
jgi:hypothetical protein